MPLPLPPSFNNYFSISSTPVPEKDSSKPLLLPNTNGHKLTQPPQKYPLPPSPKINLSLVVSVRRHYNRVVESHLKMHPGAGIYWLLRKFGIKILLDFREYIKTCFYLGDLVICVTDWKICSISGRLPNNPGELAYN